MVTRNKATRRQGRGTIVGREARCTGCGLCIPECPVDVIGFGERLNSRGYLLVELVAPGCLPCNRCAVVCPDLAIDVYRFESDDEVAKEYKRLNA